MEISILKLESPLEKFISANNSSGNLRGEKDISLISQSVLPNLKFIRPLMMRVTVAHLLRKKRNPAGML